MVIRLIDTKSGGFVLFEREEEIPPYAILSHTWVHGEEISFKEMQEISNDPNHPARERSGFRKIANTCYQARGHMLDFAWIDTCCIDKKDPTELGEAINSMFKWYQQAAICYVYLEDYSEMGSLGGCRWFSRGWCLQELIAPNRIIFYDRHWERVGDKLMLEDYLSDITNVDKDILRGEQSLDTVPIARRMSWAAKRNTARIEDQAYCLLGIFDIHMPLLYGEGANAFIRFQEEIIKRSEDLSIFAPAADVIDSQDVPAQPCNLLATSPKEFANFGQLTPTRGLDLTAQPFTMTNFGLNFLQQELGVFVSWEEPIYTLSLQCELGPNQKLYLRLQQIAPSRFILVRGSRGLTQTTDSPQEFWSTGSIYISAKFTPGIKSLIDISSKRIIRFTIGGGTKIGFTPADDESRLQWDHSRKAFFLTSRITYVSVKFDIPGKINNYICCCINRSNKYVRFWTSGVWGSAERDSRSERDERRRAKYGNKHADEIRLNSTMAKVKLREEEYGYSVALRFDDE
ncbi:HET-domain-containing protein [Hypoxylon trugodes]|uniref:HET-domain-containing protein n=1 Tax=Hypoxylon trugodes TaxID=326681 RepID=UPI00219F5319|nr:HET-domain-containing protein [Hypoxylon trugodes]KAI1391422.1 HET-domain-containing protein [Hypoxylon trugodes]